jgi:hypothetical protein
VTARLYPDTFYVNGNPIPAAYFVSLDAAQAAAINADAGGTWNPSTTLTVAGAGVWCAGPWTFDTADIILATVGSPYRLTHGADDWVELGTGHAGATRALRTSLGTAADTSYWLPGQQPRRTGIWEASTPYIVGNAVVPVPATGFVFECTTPGTTNSSPPTWPTTLGATVAEGGGSTVVWTCLQAIGIGQPRLFVDTTSQGALVEPAGASFVGGGRLSSPLRVHNGATLTALLVTYEISAAHSGAASLPESLPQMRVIRVDMFGDVVPLYTNTNPAVTAYYGNGWVGFYQAPFPTPTAYYDGGAVQSTSYPLDPGIVIDTSQYAYLVQVIDESGAGSFGGNIYVEAVADFDPIPDLRPQ